MTTLGGMMGQDMLFMTYTVDKPLKSCTTKENAAPALRFDKAFVSKERAIKSTITRWTQDRFGTLTRKIQSGVGCGKENKAVTKDYLRHVRVLNSLYEFTSIAPIDIIPIDARRSIEWNTYIIVLTMHCRHAKPHDKGREKKQKVRR
jgi:hypothetical protein